MKYAGIVLLVFGLAASFCGTAILTAFARPPEWKNWGWHIAGREVHLNQYALWWYTESADGGRWSTTIVPYWPPRVQYDFMSAEHRRLVERWLHDENWNDPTAEVNILLNQERKNDDKKYWVWPDWYGYNPSLSQ